jgi:hypothetical protein
MLFGLSLENPEGGVLKTPLSFGPLLLSNSDQVKYLTVDESFAERYARINETQKSQETIAYQQSGRAM